MGKFIILIKKNSYLLAPLHSMWDLVLRLGIESTPPAEVAQSLKHWTIREVPLIGNFRGT